MNEFEQDLIKIDNLMTSIENDLQKAQEGLESIEIDIMLLKTELDYNDENRV